MPQGLRITVLAVLDMQKLIKVLRSSLPHGSKLGNSQKSTVSNSQKFTFGQAPWGWARGLACSTPKGVGLLHPQGAWSVWSKRHKLRQYHVKGTKKVLSRMFKKKSKYKAQCLGAFNFCKGTKKQLFRMLGSSCWPQHVAQEKHFLKAPSDLYLIKRYTL